MSFFKEKDAKLNGLFGDYIMKDEDLEKRGDIYCNVCRNIEMAESVFDELKKIEKN